MDPFVIAVIAVAVSTMWMVVRHELRKRAKERADRKAFEVALHEALREASGELTLAEPTASVDARDPIVLFTSSGELEGAEADLSVGAHGWHQVIVKVGAPLPEQLALVTRPHGRAAEDFYIGVAADSGNSLFDAHFAVSGPADKLKAYAKTIDAKLLELMIDHHGDSFDLAITPKEVRVTPGRDKLPSEGANMARWSCTAAELILMWRTAERVVRDGLARGVLARISN